MPDEPIKAACHEPVTLLDRHNSAKMSSERTSVQHGGSHRSRRRPNRKNAWPHRRLSTDCDGQHTEATTLVPGRLSPWCEHPSAPNLLSLATTDVVSRENRGDRREEHHQTSERTARGEQPNRANSPSPKLRNRGERRQRALFQRRQPDCSHHETSGTHPSRCAVVGARSTRIVAVSVSVFTRSDRARRLRLLGRQTWTTTERPPQSSNPLVALHVGKLISLAAFVLDAQRRNWVDRPNLQQPASACT